MPSPPIMNETTTSAPAVQSAGDSMSGPVASSDHAGCRRVTRGAVIRFGLLIALIAGLGTLALTVGPDRHALMRAAEASGALAPIVAVFGSALLAAAILPRTLLALVGGLMFGWVDGAMYVIAGVTIGASLAFGVGRLLGRDFVDRRMRGRLRHIEQAVASRGALAVLISRMVPLVPFGISNYAFGTTSVSRRSFFLGTLLGVAPATIAYSALGAATAHRDATGMTIAGATVAALGLAGSVGSYLLWRRRPRRSAA